MIQIFCTQVKCLNYLAYGEKRDYEMSTKNGFIFYSISKAKVLSSSWIEGNHWYQYLNHISMAPYFLGIGFWV